ncbi:MAG TPA: arginine deiminase family protein [Bryobacteraceae bacterium]|jgi:dimethylargininase|nr:arginine deiminase family protein [Bryobacteraceae bacterium]
MQEVFTAITRSVSPAMNHCELAYLPRQAIDLDKAARQHRQYESCLSELGVRVISLPPEPDLPDAVFVEDPAVVADEVAVLTRMGAEPRRREGESLARALEPFRPLRRLREPATLEGGDVMRVDRTLYVGASVRTNAEGIRQLADTVSPFGYEVRAVEVRGCMHLKTGCTYLGDRTLLANRGWIDAGAFEGFRILDVAPEEPWAANVLSIGDTLMMPDAFPVTTRMLERQGWKVRTLDVSELMKAEAGLTCMSILFA